MVQWLRFHISNVGGEGLIPVQGTKIPYAEWPKKKKKGCSVLFVGLCQGFPREDFGI